MMTKTYPAIIFRQRPNSPLQVAFAAASSEIDSWARVPTKRTGNIRNFQRAELPGHIKEVETFFNDTNNASPTAVVVGFDPIRAKGAVRVETEEGTLDEHKLEPGMPLTGKISIDWPVDPGAQSKEERIARIMEWRPKLEAFIFEELQEIAKLDTETLARLGVRIASGIKSGELRDFDADDDESQSEEDLEETDAEVTSDEGDGVGIDALPDDISGELLIRPLEVELLPSGVRLLSRAPR